jgi:cytochrome c peroxidase
MHTCLRLFAATLLYTAAFIANAAGDDTPESLLQLYAGLARQSDPAFAGFSAERGKALYQTPVLGPNGEHACQNCHSPDPRETVFGHSGAIRAECSACHIGGMGKPGERARIRRDIKPLAPAANPARFTDAGKVELWFDVNCFYVLGRACSAQEKGDFLTYLLTWR